MGTFRGLESVAFPKRLGRGRWRKETWSEVKRIAVDRIRWKRFTDALCSTGSSRN
jgi:hypothetical protein